MKEGTQSLSPLTAPALRDSAVYTILRSYRIWGEPGGGGETPIERLSFLQSQKNKKNFLNAKKLVYTGTTRLP